jgi:hypothetical protein
MILHVAICAVVILPGRVTGKKKQHHDDEFERGLSSFRGRVRDTEPASGSGPFEQL